MAKFIDTELDISKLPRVYREHVQTLRARVRELEHTQESQTPTRVIIDPSHSRTYIPSDATVRFQLTDRVDDYLDCRLEENTVCIRSGVSGDTLAVFPHVSNVVYVGFRRRR